MTWTFVAIVSFQVVHVSGRGTVSGDQTKGEGPDRCLFVASIQRGGAMNGLPTAWPTTDLPKPRARTRGLRSMASHSDGKADHGAPGLMEHGPADRDGLVADMTKTNLKPIGSALKSVVVALAGLTPGTLATARRGRGAT
jgi:hypothetical protein